MMISKMMRVLSIVVVFQFVTGSAYPTYFSQFRMGMPFETVKKIIAKNRLAIIPYNPPLRDIVHYIVPLADKKTHPYAQYPEEIKIPYLHDRASYFGALADFRFIFSPKSKLLSVIGIVWTLDNDKTFGHGVRNKIALSLFEEPKQIGEGYRYIWPFERPATHYRIYLEYGRKGEVLLYFYGYKHFPQFVKEVEEMKTKYDQRNQTEEIDG